MRTLESRKKKEKRKRKESGEADVKGIKEKLVKRMQI